MAVAAIVWFAQVLPPFDRLRRDRIRRLPWQSTSPSMDTDGPSFPASLCGHRNRRTSYVGPYAWLLHRNLVSFNHRFTEIISVNNGESVDDVLLVSCMLYSAQLFLFRSSRNVQSLLGEVFRETSVLKLSLNWFLSPFVRVSSLPFHTDDAVRRFNSLYRVVISMTYRLRPSWERERMSSSEESITNCGSTGN